jgi:poly-beta-1,6-N-acetyl-D-glucosamine synthase
MNPAFIFIFCLLTGYAWLLLWLASGFLRMPSARRVRLEPVPLTVIICARNERYNIGLCLKTIAMQDYPKAMLELILVDDHSSDNTVAAAEEILNESGITYRIIKNSSRLGKKQSISKAVLLAANPLIILRDADTYTSSGNWLRSVSDFYQYSHADFIIAPVVFEKKKGFLFSLQALENDLLNMFTAGSAYFNKPFLCNGANLVFTKTVFQKTGGYSSHEHIESGDDILLMEDVKKIPGVKIAYLNNVEAVVETYAVRTIKKLVDQRVRWASKFKYNRNPLNFSLALLVFAVNACFIAAMINVLVNPNSALQAMLFIFFKLTFDLLLLFLASRSRLKAAPWAYILPVAIVYPFYAVTVAVLSLFKKPRWNQA